MDKKSEKLHLGCGLITPSSWINVDGSWNALLAKHPLVKKILMALHLAPARLFDIPWSAEVVFHDVRRPLPFEDDSMEAVYASHLLEHVYLEEAKKLLGECFRVLKPGGVLRIMVPDLRGIVSQYNLRQPTNESKADRMIKSLDFCDTVPPSGNIFYRLYSYLKDLHAHRWMYDSDSLIFYLRGAGFNDVMEMPLHSSKIQNIEEVELNEGLCVEGVKAG